MFLINFPLMLVPFAVYNFFIIGAELNPWEDLALRVDMISGASFSMTMGEALIVLSLGLLFIEILKAARTGVSTRADNLLSTLVLVFYLVEFLLVQRAASSTFFILMVVTLLDVVVGYSLSTRNASRNLTIER